MTGGAKPCIAVFHSSDLSFITYQVLNQFSGLGWCAINPENGFLYTSDKHLSHVTSSKYSPVVCYSIDYDLLENQQILSLTEVERIILKGKSGSPVTLKHMQGGTFDNENHLFLMNGYCKDFNEKDGGISVYNIQTGIAVAKSQSGSGSFNYEFHPGWSKYEEPEGLTYWDLNDGRAPNIRGVLHAIMLDNDVSDDDLYFKHYDKVLTSIGNANTFPDLDKIYIANKNPGCLEVHQKICSWADNIAAENIKYYGSLQQALDDGFDGCYYCLNDYHKR